MACPFECTYLLDSRNRDGAALEGKPLPYPDVKLGRAFVERNTPLVEILASAAVTTAARTPGALDGDLREALEVLVKTRRTLESGIHYERQPESSFARTLAAAMQESLKTAPEGAEDELGVFRRHEFDVLETLVFMLRLSYEWDNGRPRGRSFLHLLTQQFETANRARLKSSPSLLHR